MEDLLRSLLFGIEAETLLYEADRRKENLEAQFPGAHYFWLSHGLHHHREISGPSFLEHLHSRMLQHTQSGVVSSAIKHCPCLSPK